jgi:hypothetical protein
VTRRDWVRTFADPAILSDLRDAMRSMSAQLDDCDPSDCTHPEQRVHPMEVADWVEREVHVAGQRPTRFERGHRPRRKQQELARVDRLNLSQAG